ncbi:MAG: hypothetical protein R6V55_10045 [Desulfovermiculus sp.]
MGLKHILSNIKKHMPGQGAKEEAVRLLSFRVLYLCIFLPPVLYIFTIQGLERYWQHTWTQELSQSLIQDRQALLRGKTRLQDQIKRNIEQFLQTRRVTKLGVELQVSVRTTQGNMLYPFYELQHNLPSKPAGIEDQLYKQLQENFVGLENQRILQQGLSLNVSVHIPRNTWLANIVLLLYIFSFAGILYFSYQSRVRASENAARRQQQELESTRQRLEQERDQLVQAKEQQETYQQQVDELQHRLQDADSQLRSTEEEALSELEALEQRLAETDAEREAREMEIHELTEKLDSLESQQQGQGKKKEKVQSFYSKRFQTLYKNLIFNERAVQGFAHLPEDWKLKAEEVIHTLNADPGLVTVKRKVFSRSDVVALETEFAHKGRIYWHRNDAGKTTILAVGTKNTQNKDLKYIEGLGG